MAGLGKDREASGATAASGSSAGSTPTSSSDTSRFSSAGPDYGHTEREVVHEHDTGEYERGLQRGREEGLREGYSATDPAAEQRRKDAYGGLNLGASFFGWLVAIALTILLTGILSAIAAGLADKFTRASELDISTAEFRSEAGTVGMVTGIVLLVVLMIGYYAGGYVAGRMSRFDGVKQGIGVWVIGLLVTIVVAVITAVAGAEYDVFRYIPSIPIPTDTLTQSGLIALGAVLLGTLLAAIVGGKVGQRYHTKVDRIS
jgi:amino acid transporter